MKEWEKWVFEPIDTYARPPENQKQIELCFAIFFGSTMSEAKEILRSPAGERILQEAKNNKWTTHTIAKEMQNYVDYLEEKAENITTNGSGNSIP